MGCKVLTRNVSHFAALLRYMAVKTHILYIYIYIYIYLFIYCNKAAIYYSSVIFTTQTVS